MYTMVLATCERCGDVELLPGDVELRLCSHEPASTYRFICPSCGRYTEKPADDGRIVALLLSAGARVSRWDLPAEATETHDGPPLTVDDVLDFHLLLEQPDWIDRLSATASG